MKNLEKYSPYVLALLRIVAAYMFILHGTAKFWEFPISMTGGNGAVGDPMMIVGGVIEIVGSILLILGLFVRPAAFILSGQMAYAYFFMHAAGKGNLFCVCWCRRIFSRQPQTLVNYLINLLPAFRGLFYFKNRLNKSPHF